MSTSQSDYQAELNEERFQKLCRAKPKSHRGTMGLLNAWQSLVQDMRAQRSREVLEIERRLGRLEATHAHCLVVEQALRSAIDAASLLPPNSRVRIEYPPR